MQKVEIMQTTRTVTVVSRKWIFITTTAQPAPKGKANDYRNDDR